jgi:putative FmdB family regulatory protein
MPRYDYRCESGHVTEVERSITEPPLDLVGCSSCRRSTRRVFAPPSAIDCRGPGFYATDVKGRVERKRRPNPVTRCRGAAQGSAPDPSSNRAVGVGG